MPSTLLQIHGLLFHCVLIWMYIHISKYNLFSPYDVVFMYVFRTYHLARTASCRAPPYFLARPPVLLPAYLPWFTSSLCRIWFLVDLSLATLACPVSSLFSSGWTVMLVRLMSIASDITRKHTLIAESPDPLALRIILLLFLSVP